jgi:hypothetical protein
MVIVSLCSALFDWSPTDVTVATAGALSNGRRIRPESGKYSMNKACVVKPGAGHRGVEKKIGAVGKSRVIKEDTAVNHPPLNLDNARPSRS